MTDVSLAGAFLAGLVSFLSPCVLPLVPGYISMLSGIGMEQLRQGEVPRSGLFSSAMAFVAGFSVVFIAFGASASAVGVFLKQNRNMLTPVAGALILLFGLHLLGLLIKLSPRVGIILGVMLIAFGITSLLRHSPRFPSSASLVPPWPAGSTATSTCAVLSRSPARGAASSWASRLPSAGPPALAPSSRRCLRSRPQATKFSAACSSWPSIPPAWGSRFF